MKGDLTIECRDNLVKALGNTLDTRDKRYMFLRMEFRTLVPRINLEGSASEASWQIYCEFEKQCMLGSLIACLNAKLDTGIIFETVK